MQAATYLKQVFQTIISSGIRLIKKEPEVLVPADLVS